MPLLLLYPALPPLTPLTLPLLRLPPPSTLLTTVLTPLPLLRLPPPRRPPLPLTPLPLLRPPRPPPLLSSLLLP
jgi:hypothetical protein